LPDWLKSVEVYPGESEMPMSDQFAPPSFEISTTPPS
jgi:hypothetical protein